MLAALLFISAAPTVLAEVTHCVMCPACDYSAQVAGHWLDYFSADAPHVFQQHDTLCYACRRARQTISQGA
jgi:hypothetical protein